MSTYNCGIYFKGLSSKTRSGKGILHNLNGKFPPGSLIAIIGPSGAGKTTFLNVLSGYSSQTTCYDALEINGTPKTFEDISKIACYVTQDIYLNDLLTMEENLQFMIDFKLGDSHPQNVKTKMIQELLDSFDMAMSRNTMTGKLSGGERKRLALASNMINDPSIICLDEPTTGLDISTANQILKYLKKMAKSGKTVICSIHQVCALHFALFDFAYIVTDGQCAYQGPPKDLVPFLKSCGMPCSVFHNPAEFVVELCSGDYGIDKPGLLVQASENGEAYIKQIASNEQEKVQNESLSIQSGFRASWMNQYKTLIKREYIKLYRNRILLSVRLISSNIIGLLFGILFLNNGNNAAIIINSYLLAFMICGNTILTGILYPIITFPSQIQLVKGEVFNKCYTCFQYYTTVVATDLPILTLAVSSSSMTAWYVSGQPMELERIFVFQLFMITLGWFINILGYFFGSLEISINAAVQLGGVGMLPMFALCGMGSFIKDQPWILEHFGRILYVRNAFQGCLVSMLGLTHRKMECLAEFCLYTEPHRLLLDTGIDPQHYFSYWLILIIWIIMFTIITYFCLKYKLSCR